MVKNMEKQMYESPTAEVVEMKAETALLQASNRSSATLNATYSEEDWDNE